MISSFEVGSIFRVIDKASPEILKISNSIFALEERAGKALSKLETLAKMKFTGTADALKGLGINLSEFGDKSGLVSNSVIKSFAKVDGGIEGTIKMVGNLNKAIGETKAAMAGLRVPSGGGRRDLGERSHGGGGGHVGMALGIGGFIGAEEVGHGLLDAYKHAAEFQHVQEQMRQGGFSTADIEKSKAAAWSVGGKLGMSVSTIMSDIKEIRQPFGSVDEVVKFIEPLERMRVVLNAVSEGKGNSSKEAVYEMVRAGELKGLNDPKEYMQYFDEMTKVISATGGKVGPKEFMQATKYTRLAGLGMNEEFYTKYLPTLIQSLGASGAGTASAALFGTLVQGKATGRATQAMDDLGLIGDRSKLRFDKAGNPMGFSSGAIVDTDKIVSNPFQWVKEDLLPRLEKKFGALDNEKSRGNAIKSLGDFFGNRMSSQDVGEFLLRMKSFDRDAGFNAAAFGTGGAGKLQEQDPAAAMAKLSGAFSNLMTALGGSLVGPAVQGMNLLSGGLTQLTDWARAHPDAVKNIAVGLAGAATALGASAVVAGAIFLAPGGAIALAATTIAGVVTGLAALNWKSLASGLSSLWDSIKSFFSHGPGGDDGYIPGAFHGVGVGGRFFNTSYETGGEANDNGGGFVGGGLADKIMNSAGGGGFNTRGVRNLNPGNIGWGAWARAHGATAGAGADSGHLVAVFPSFEAGYAAMGSLALSKYGSGARSIDQLIAGQHGWTPGNHAAAANVARMMGISPYEDARLTELSMLAKFKAGLSVQELGPAGARYARNHMRTAGAPPRASTGNHHHFKIELDGRQIEARVTHHQAERGQFPTAVGSIDPHGSFASPGTYMDDVA